MATLPGGGIRGPTSSSAATRNNIPVGRYRVESTPSLTAKDYAGAAAQFFDLTGNEKQILRLSMASDLSADPAAHAVWNLAIRAANGEFALQFGFYFAAKLGERYEKIWTSLAREYVGRPLALAGVRDGSTLRLYVDGKLVNQKTFSGGYIASTSPISVGTNLGDRELFGFAPRNWRGKIFSLRISDTVRAPEELITTQSVSNPIDEHTLALYRFEEGQGETLKDSSGNEQHGKIVGAKWLTSDANEE